ncbi:MAG: hypothetical protein KDM64_10890 [Verrucomicrobiae bacterium]|nr:hypothetical protein [Verrucomicrobiae bacterium]
MNDTRTRVPLGGPVIEALSQLSGLDADTVTLEASAVLGALAGPQGGLIGWGGEFLRGRFHLVLTGPNSERHSRLLDLLLEPARLIQEGLRQTSAGILPSLVNEMAQRFDFPDRPYPIRRGSEEEYTRAQERFEERMKGWSAMKHGVSRSQLCEPVADPWYNQLTGRRGGRNQDERLLPELAWGQIELLREPTVLTPLSGGVTESDLRKLLAETDQQWLLGVDREGTFLRGLLESQPSKRDRSARDWMAGTDLTIPGLPGLGSLRHGRLTVISLLGDGGLRSLPGGDADKVWPSATLLGGGAIEPSEESTDPELDASSPPDAKEVARHHEQYRQVVQEVIAARRRRSTFSHLTLAPEEAIRLREGLERFTRQLETVEPERQPYCVGLSRLPVALLFGLKLLASDSSLSGDLVETSLAVAHRAMRRHLHHLEQLGDRTNLKALDHQKKAMMRKLARLGACTWRDLLRSYPIQRKALHEPVLQSLVDEGLVERSRDGHLRLLVSPAEAPGNVN